jgi:hypothetical protein
MLNAFDKGVKSPDPKAVVVTAGTAPFGDPQVGGQRIMPALFWRDVLCVREAAGGLRSTRCKDPAHFDVFAHHPYSVGSPDTAALNADDVSIPDLGKLTQILRAAERTGGALPRVRHPLWITEVSYDSSPPDPQGVPIARQARFLEQAVAELWTEGASVVIWNQVGDQLPIPSYAATNQSGVFFIDGRAKPALTAFRFPFVVRRTGSTRVSLWGRAASAGRLVVERRSGSAWKAMRTLDVAAKSTFGTTLRLRGAATLRARVGSETSLTWAVASI